MHWAHEIAEKLISMHPDKEEFVCAAGISPSGSVHIGNFRDIATSLFVAKALRAKGKKAKLLFSWDDFDRFRKVPVNVQKVVSGYEEHIGKPYTMFPDPFGKYESYGEYFEKEFEDALRRIGVEYEVRYQTKMYQSGAYLEQIKLALSKRKEIYDILMRFKTQEPSDEEREKFYPISVYDFETLKDNTTVNSYNEETGEITYFSHDTKKEHTVNINDYKLIKLVWKVDWPMRWMYENVDFEPGGIDHASNGGSFDVSSVIVREIFNHEPPLFQGYGWLGIKGLGDMHSSSGMNITPGKILEIYEPEMVKWLFAKYLPQDAFDFTFDDTVLRHYYEFDRGVESYLNGTALEYEQQMFDMILPQGKNTQLKTSFASIASVAPMVDFNKDTLKVALKKAGIEFDESSVERLEKVKNWLQTYNPHKIYQTLPEFNAEYYDKLSQEEKEAILKLHDYIANNEFTEKDVQQKLYDIINDPNLTKKENVEKQKTYFKNFYNMLFGTDEGPRLYLFLAASNKNKILPLLNK